MLQLYYFFTPKFVHLFWEEGSPRWKVVILSSDFFINPSPSRTIRIVGELGPLRGNTFFLNLINFGHCPKRGGGGPAMSEVLFKTEGGRGGKECG